MSFRFIISLALFLFLNLLSNYSHTTEAAPNYLENYCPNTTLFAPNSTYQSNLNTLLSSLSSAADDTDGFTNATAGKDAPDHAYGLFLCRGDISTATCSECVATGIKEVVRRCPRSRISAIWYDECMLKYSDESIYSVMETVPLYDMPDAGNVADPDRFVKLLGETMNDAAERASGSEAGKKFAAVEANFTSSQKLYTLAQCTPDLTASDCNTCLRAVIATLPQGKVGGRSFTPTCGVRFELYPFYNASAVAVVVLPAPQFPPPAPSNRPKGKSNKSTIIIVAVAVPVGIAVILLFVAFCLPWSKTTKKYEVVESEGGASEITTAESLQYHLATIQVATNNFSHQNKLGQGGFGEVFQGRLPNGQEIAVKRLSKGSGQGVGEFKNEVVLVAKLQHRNLVRLIGFCLEGEEKILVYEFVPNKSLDYFLFDLDKRRQLDWSRRYKIISGIARGMLYLHEDSRLRIIHRDLKPSNVLLDSDMNPKISDFGMARILRVDQTRTETSKIVGTFGYLSPEYAMRGQISVKSDVYSFGVLILEIISGKKNSCFFQSDGGENLASYAWKHWRAGTPLEMLDPSISDLCSIDEVIRCLHIGLLGVQEDPADRPTMASIVLMLSSQSVNLPQPRQPAFFLQKGMERQLKELKSDESTGVSMPRSINEMSVTEVYPR